MKKLFFIIIPTHLLTGILSIRLNPQNSSSSTALIKGRPSSTVQGVIGAFLALGNHYRLVYN
jgi:hypothetical protein